MRSLVVGLAVLGLLAGCASSSSDGWTKAGASQQDLARDELHCLAQARMLDGGPQGPRAVIQQDRYRRCMVERGRAEGPRK
ncbi:MAG: hypothetical protein AUF60_08010 [Gemmatimonadetes bacterium 13_1_20CM_69_28]|nr:MAG: hypothetical protein AUF60_08010 [Gemmatimonadetes bacterium 13_1_20CM_69_28]